MPRTPRPKPNPAVIPSPSLVASAVKYPGKAARIYLPTQEWQREAYRQFEICGEARFAATLFGNAMSRATLKAMRRKTDGTLAPGTAHARGLLAQLFNGRHGQPQMLRALGVHLTIAGECYLIGRKVNGADLWEVVSVLEVAVTGDTWTVTYSGVPEDDPTGQFQPITLNENDVVIRIWQPHPARRMEADSPFRSMLPVLREIEWATMHIFAQLQSRLAGAGLLFLTQGMTFPKPPEEDENGTSNLNEAEQFMRMLAHAMLTPISKPDSPEALVPPIVQVPHEVMKDGKIAELLHFWSEIDAEAKNIRDDAISRFADGFDLPREQVMGMSSNSGTGGGSSNGVSHWGAWQIEESTIKMFVEPMLELVVNALIIGFLRPLTDDVADVIVYDTSALRLRPDRSLQSLELFDRGLVGLDVVLREHGFEDTDGLDEAGQKAWLLRKIASGSATPEQVARAASLLYGIDLPGAAPAPAAVETRESRPEPSLEDHPARPRTPGDDPVLAASNVLVIRALEKAGNRIRQKGVKVEGTPAYEMHTLYQVNGDADQLLTGAWSCAEMSLDGLCDVSKTTRTLDSYVRTLMIEQSPHSRARLSKFLEAVR